MYNIDIKGKRIVDLRTVTVKEDLAMKKTKGGFDRKDRVVCVTVQGGHEVYYQPIGSKEHNDFSGSVFAYFHDKGSNINGKGFNLTIKERYEFKRFYNGRLTTVINRILMMLDCVLREKDAGRDIIATREETGYALDSEGHKLAS